MTEYLNVGDMLPDLISSSLAGEAIKLRDYQGKKFILFMWASW